MNPKQTTPELPDPLLQIPGRRTFTAHLQEFAEHSSDEQPLSLLLIDLDKFKQVNDLYGHQAGDEALQSVASVIRKVTEDNGHPYRYGGDEIVFLLPNHSTQEAACLSERIRRGVEGLRLRLFPESLTLSIGIASYPMKTNRPLTPQLSARCYTSSKQWLPVSTTRST